MHSPHTLLEAYYSIYEQPKVNEEYLDEEEQYFYDIAEFLLDEGFTEEEIYELTEEEDFLDILEVIEEAKKRTKTQIRQMGLSGRRTRQMGAEPRQLRGGQPVGASGKKLGGKAKTSAETDIEAIRKARAERRQGTDRLASKQAGTYHVRQRLKNMEREMDKKPEQKPAAQASKPSQSLVGRLRSAAAAGMERHRQATQTAGKVAKGVGAYLGTKHAATASRASASKPANKSAIERLARQKAHKAAASEDFEYVLNYVMEEGYDYEEALEIIEELDDDTIEMILED